MTLLAKLVGEDKNCKWIYRFWANPGMPRGGVLPPTQSWHRGHQRHERGARLEDPHN